MDILKELRSHPVFAGLSAEASAEAASLGKAVTYEAGAVCIRQGEAGEIFGILISGRLEACCVLDGGRRELLGTIEPGQCFGEMSLLTGNAASAEVRASEKSESIVFLQEAIGPVIALNPEAIQFLTRMMFQRLAPSPGRPAPPAPRAVGFSLGASLPMRILSVSCRKDDLRYSYFDTTSEHAQVSGNVSGLSESEAVHCFQGRQGPKRSRIGRPSHEAALAAMLETLTSPDGAGLGSANELSAIGHRVCHGGARFNGPAVVNEEIRQEISRLSSLAPMENPYNLIGIELCEKMLPDVPQVAVFDTAFHLKLPDAACCYALPNDLATDRELRRFGGHGISHEGAARAACAFLGVNFRTSKIVTCHLGTGASLTAIDHSRPVDTTMGMTPLGGLIMSTRSGDIDPGLLLHLITQRGLSPAELTTRLYTESGLLGLSGISGDVLTVLKAADNGEPGALLAIQAYCQSARKYLSSYIGLLGGVDGIVFTGGVGENAPGVRARICQNLEWMGIRLDDLRNRSSQVGPGEVAQISQFESRAHILVVGSNEEHTIARHAVRALGHQRVTEVIRHQHKRIPISVSAHHVHLTEKQVEILFGPGQKLTWHADLSQPGQFACKEQVTLVGPKGRVERVRILGPVRDQGQVEIARTEEFRVGIDAPIRMSGDLDGTPGITLEGPKGRIELPRGVICAMRHIHMSPQDAMEFAVRDRDLVRVRICGQRSLIFGDVMIRVSPDFRLDMHIDTDEGNAAEMNAEAASFLDSIQERASVL